MGVFMCGWISSRVEYQDQQFPKPHYVMALRDIIHESKPLLKPFVFKEVNASLVTKLSLVLS